MAGGRRGHPHWRRREPSPRRVRPEDVAVGLSLEEVQDLIGDMFGNKAEGTQNIYQKHWSYFCRWFRNRRLTPAESGGRSRPLELSDVVSNHVRVYLKNSRANGHRSVSWVCCAAAAIRCALEFEGLDHQVDWNAVRGDLRGFRKRGRLRPASADGLTREIFEMVETAAVRPKDGEWPEQTNRRVKFDVALIALMRDCLLRRSEAAAATWGDISVERKPGHVFGVLEIPHSKTDQFGKGQVGYVHISTLIRLQEMAVACGRDINNPKEPIFGITDGQIARRIKGACEHAGLMGRYSGHSPRVGMAMDLATYNTPLVGVMQSGRWRIPSTVVKYIQSIAAGDGAVAMYHRHLNPVTEAGPVPAREWM